MRLARFSDDGPVQLGAVVGGHIHPLIGQPELLEILCLPKTMRDAIEAEAVARGGKPVENVTLLAPYRPGAMRDFVVFEEHVVGVSKSVAGVGGVAEAWYEAPAFLFMNPHSLTGPNDDIPMPPLTKALDFELEVAAIVGRTVRDVNAAEARDHIVGYAVFNDWSARDIQKREMQVSLGPSKGKDFANTMGPWITTPDELDDHRSGDRLNLTMTVSVNGHHVGGDNLKNMAWSFEELLVHASRDAWVGAGDVLATGTCASGALAEFWGRAGVQDPPPLTVGDTVTMTVEGLGSISNRIIEQRSPGIQVPAARTDGSTRKHHEPQPREEARQ
ncbi:fumarylacetoacetate hydrolase family protein [Paenarthrobacter sp. TYUT067]|uniref:fumarylacetoacetate hydrolase family protein n=1 Tax=Paenarthrobacter sp. TYUT067 TaxID=2926245 RepID=UPI00202FF148|nr:fumarylacetoacetate hydrolase family protein [Paenarthrobacter sp. TYUT067]MCM0616845.1 fumarylacetoacetate hydrolase family protein [Paenarthrobacter sp. TYUT067]